MNIVYHKSQYKASYLRDTTLAIADSVLLVEDMPGGERFASLYPFLPGAAGTALEPATAADLSAVTHLRFDPVNACNIRCVFCHSDFSGAIKHLLPDHLEKIAALASPSLKMVSVGCAYEPLMGNYFERYPDSLKSVRGNTRARIITNGLLLHRKDISPWIDFGMEYLHVSVHSHIPEVYERTIGNGGRLTQVSRNIREVRVKFPDLEICLYNVVARSNSIAIGDFCRWAFDEIGANRVSICRAHFEPKPNRSYPSWKYVTTLSATSSLGPALTDAEWALVLNECLPYMNEGQAGAVRIAAKEMPGIWLNRPSSYQSRSSLEYRGERVSLHARGTEWLPHPEAGGNRWIAGEECDRQKPR